jgi:N-dimethylarginine dimethylaminohydrolase
LYDPERLAVIQCDGAFLSSRGGSIRFGSGGRTSTEPFRQFRQTLRAEKQQNSQEDQYHFSWANAEHIKTSLRAIFYIYQYRK